jgi:hypothetical protein
LASWRIRLKMLAESEEACARVKLMAAPTAFRERRRSANEGLTFRRLEKP